MSALTQQHRAKQLLLRRATVDQFAHLWPMLDWARLDATYPAFAVSVAKLVQTNRKTSAGLAAAYLRAFRKAQGVPGAIRTAFPEPLNVEQFTTSLGTTSVAAIKTATSKGVAQDVAMANGLTLASGVVSRLVLNAGRSTIVDTLQVDDRAAGWRRVLGGGGCDFCRERAGVRMTSAEVFEAHGNCGCTAEPVYRA